MTSVDSKCLKFLYCALAFLVVGFLLTSPTLAQIVPPDETWECQNDIQGADDEPGQKDVTQFCEKPSINEISFNWDNKGWNGNNTGDACALFDTDNDNFANYALCVTVEEDPAVQSNLSPRLYLCNDDRAERCSGAVEQVGFASDCSVGYDLDPPFTGTSCAGTDCATEDTQAYCLISASDVIGLADLLDVCSYPSEQPNSDPSDCVAFTPDPCFNVDCSGNNTTCATYACDSAGAIGNCDIVTYAPNTTICNAAAGVCDLAEYCTGSSATCPADGPNLTTQCRASAGICDVAEFCSDASDDCPANGYVAAGVQCAASAGECDLAEYCTGSSAACPADGANLTTQCRASAGICDVAEFCSDASDTCPVDGFVAAGTECAASAGECDLAEECTGSSAACPADGANLTTQCRASAGICDVAEYCSDASDTCPVDGFVTAGTECAASAGECDLAEECTGSSAACPADGANLTTECRASAGVCDLAEFCSDASDDCPTDSFRPDTYECRASAGICDEAESCTGSSADCPTNGFLPSTELCREATDVCDVDEYCTGSAAECPSDGFAPAGTTCSEGGTGPSEVCNPPQECTGTSEVCPTYVPPSGPVECRPGGECDSPEYCEGIECPPDTNTFEPGDLCGDDSDTACTDPDTCEDVGGGVLVCSPNNTPCAYVTNSGLCTFDEYDGEECGVEREFNLLYTPSVQELPAYKQNASNPGQYYYNLIYDGTAGETATVTVTIPYPFITQGANPLHIYDGEYVAVNGCFVPYEAGVAEPVQITLDNWKDGASGVGDYNLDCDEIDEPGEGVCSEDGTSSCYGIGSSCGTGLAFECQLGTCSFDVDFTVPASGQAYINVHLDYGLKGVKTDAWTPAGYDRYQRGSDIAVIGYDAYPAGDGSVIAIADCQNYPFSHDVNEGEDTGEDTVASVNDFKKLTGGFGTVANGSSPITDASIFVFRNDTGEIVGSTTTDIDGYWGIAYQHKGKATTYTAVIVFPGAELLGPVSVGNSLLGLEDSVSVEFDMKANGWAEVSYDAATDTWTVESSADRTNGGGRKWGK